MLQLLRGSPISQRACSTAPAKSHKQLQQYFIATYLVVYVAWFVHIIMYINLTM